MYSGKKKIPKLNSFGMYIDLLMEVGSEIKFVAFLNGNVS